MKIGLYKGKVMCFLLDGGAVDLSEWYKINPDGTFELQSSTLSLADIAKISADKTDKRNYPYDIKKRIALVKKKKPES